MGDAAGSLSINALGLRFFASVAPLSSLALPNFDWDLDTAYRLSFLFFRRKSQSWPTRYMVLRIWDWFWMLKHTYCRFENFFRRRITTCLLLFSFLQASANVSLGFLHSFSGRGFFYSPHTCFGIHTVGFTFFCLLTAGFRCNSE